MTRLFTILTVAAMALTLTSVAKAADEPKKKKNDPVETFKKLDADKDKKLSKEEFKKFAPPAKVADAFKADEAFTKLDADKDGNISEEEFKKITEVVKKKKAK